MGRLPIDPEEMAKRHDEDFQAMIDMIGEGSPIFESYAYDDKDFFERKAHTRLENQQLPETYQ